MIKKLMGSVSRDKKGQLVVQDHLTEPAIIEQIVARAIPVFKNSKSMLQLHAPLFVVGDLHGFVFSLTTNLNVVATCFSQFTDLLRIFEVCGPPKDTVTRLQIRRRFMSVVFRRTCSLVTTSTVARTVWRPSAFCCCSKYAIRGEFSCEFVRA